MQKNLLRCLCGLLTAASVVGSASAGVPRNHGEMAADIGRAMVGLPLTTKPGVPLPIVRPQSTAGIQQVMNSVPVAGVESPGYKADAVVDIPEIYATVLSSTAWAEGESAIGLYKIKANTAGEMEMLISGVNGVYGSVYKDGIYYSSSFYNSSLFQLTSVEGYDVKAGKLVYSYEVAYTQAELLSMGMALDPLTEEIYGIFYNDDASAQVLSKISYPTSGSAAPEVTRIGSLDGQFCAFSIGKDGQFYGIKMVYGVDPDTGASECVSSVLCKIDRHSGAVTEVGETGMVPYYMGGSCVDMASGRMFWTVSPKENTTYMTEVDLSSGRANVLYTMPNGESVLGLCIEPSYSQDVPGAVSDFAVNLDGGSLSGVAVCKAPNALYGGSTATGSVKVTLCVGDKEIGTGETTYGGEVSIPFTLEQPGLYKFLIYASNEAGAGPRSSVDNVFVGKDTPVAPTATLAYVDGNMELSWLPVTAAVNGGYLDVEKLTYSVTRYPDGTKVAEGLKDTKYTEAMAEPETLTTYWYSVVAECDGKVSAEAQSNKVVIGAMTPPYYSNFEENGITGFTIINANGDSREWMHGPGSDFVYIQSNDAMKMDDWLIMPPLKLKANEAYLVTFTTWSHFSYYPESIEVKWGSTPTAEGLDKEILAPTLLRRYIRDNPLKVSKFIVPEKDGTYYIGFHGISNAGTMVLDLGNISVDAGVSAGIPMPSTNLKLSPDPTGALNGILTFTAPAQSLAGKQLESLSRIEVLKNGEVVKVIENPTPGQECSCTLTETAAGTYSYEVVAYNEAGAGLSATVSGFIGIDKPAAITNLKMVATDKVGEVMITWDPVTADQNGNPLSADLVKYNVYKASDGNLVPLAMNLTATEYSFQAVEEGEQEFVQCAVYAITSGGIGKGDGTELLPVGTPYKGLYESAPKGKPSYQWGTDNSGGARWTFFVDDSNMTSQDGDGGFMGMVATNYYQRATLFSGLVTMEGIENPGMSFYVYNKLGSNGTDVNENELLVRVRVQNGTYAEVLKSTVTKLSDGELGWRRVYIDLAEYAGKVIQIEFEACCFGFANTIIDNVNVGLVKKDQSLPVIDDLKAVLAENGVALSWSTPDFSGIDTKPVIVGYNIYRNDELMNAVPVTETEWLDTDIKSNEQYEYTVKVVYESGLGEASNTATVSTMQVGVDSVEGDSVKVAVEGHAIVILDAEGTMVTVANAAGMVIYGGEGESRMDVTVVPGVYVVKVDNLVEKVVVK